MATGVDDVKPWKFWMWKPACGLWVSCPHEAALETFARVGREIGYRVVDQGSVVRVRMDDVVTNVVSAGVSGFPARYLLQRPHLVVSVLAPDGTPGSHLVIYLEFINTTVLFRRPATAFLSRYLAALRSEGVTTQLGPWRDLALDRGWNPAR